MGVCAGSTVVAAAAAVGDAGPAVDGGGAAGSGSWAAKCARKPANKKIVKMARRAWVK